MPRNDLTDITFVLDRSGSMESIKAATIESYNGFVQSQRKGDGMAQMTLIQFDDRYELHFQGTPLQRVAELDHNSYQPRGSTALLDAMGRTIVETGKRLSRLPDRDRPGTVIFVTLTDGYENASHEYTNQRINEIIREQRDKYSWQFIFLGANQDAIATAAKMGVGAEQAMTFAASPSGTMGCWNALDLKLHKVRAAKARGEESVKFEFDESDRAAARGNGD